jgi:hypothetical protein
MIDKLKAPQQPSKLQITIEGKLGEIPFNTLATMARNSCDILDELDNAVSVKPGGTMEWVISGVSTEASITVIIEPKLKLKDVDYITLNRDPKANFLKKIVFVLLNSFLLNFLIKKDSDSTFLEDSNSI